MLDSTLNAREHKCLPTFSPPLHANGMMSAKNITEDNAESYPYKYGRRSRIDSENCIDEEEHMMESFSVAAEYDSEDTLLFPALPGERDGKRSRYGGRGTQDGCLSRIATPFVDAARRKRGACSRIARELWTIKLRVIFITTILALSSVITFHKYRYRPHLKPDEWRRHCAFQAPLSVDDYVRSKPVGILVGVMSTATDSAAARRTEIRQTWASHWASRGRWEEGRVWTPEELALRERGGIGYHNMMDPTSRVVVRFVLCRPELALRRRIKEEMDEYNDIIILPMKENVNDGKTFAFFDWSFKHALVPPPIRTNETSTFGPNVTVRNQGTGLESRSPSGYNMNDDGGRAHGWSRLNAFEARPPASHDPKSMLGVPFVNKNEWVRPEYVVKSHDDSFLMLAELEARLRTLPRKGVYWGHRVNARGAKLHSGSAYALSWDVIGQVSTYARRKQRVRHRPGFGNDHREDVPWRVPRPPSSPSLGRGRHRYQNLALPIYGHEDAVTALWMQEQGSAWGVTWYDEQCWIYDQPKAGTVDSRGFLFPLEFSKIRKEWTPFISHEDGANTMVSYEEGREQWGGSDKLRPEYQRLHDAAYSTVMRAHLRHPNTRASSWPSLYSSPLPALHELAGGNSTLGRAMEMDALIEGSALSMIVPGDDSKEDMERRWKHDVQLGWRGIYMLDSAHGGTSIPLGGTIVVHYVKSSAHWRECAEVLLLGWDRDRILKETLP